MTGISDYIVKSTKHEHKNTSKHLKINNNNNDIPKKINQIPTINQTNPKNTKIFKNNKKVQMKNFKQNDNDNIHMQKMNEDIEVLIKEITTHSKESLESDKKNIELLKNYEDNSMVSVQTQSLTENKTNKNEIIEKINSISNIFENNSQKKENISNNNDDCENCEDCEDIAITITS